MASRLDTYLVTTDAFSSRVKAKEAILSGQIVLNGNVCRTPAKVISPGDKVEVVSPSTPTFASHGGEKLEKAIATFSLVLSALRVLDIGASTGGFTECALRHGANHVYAIDVGHNQLLPSLRADPRVTAIEGLNVRDLQLTHLDNRPVNAIVCDVSFISLSFVLHKLPQLLHDPGWAALLVKPQFEVGPSRIRRGGLANSPADHLEVLQRITDQAIKLNLLPLGITHSPRLSRQKNIEYLLHVGYPAASNESSINIPAAVDLAFHEWRNS